MATSRMLGVKANVDSAITEFRDLVECADAIRYWNTSLPGWAHISIATKGVDYSLQYMTAGDLGGTRSWPSTLPFLTRQRRLQSRKLWHSAGVAHSGSVHTSFSVSILELPADGPAAVPKAPP